MKQSDMCILADMDEAVTFAIWGILMEQSVMCKLADIDEAK